ncbi:hypothetical protein RvY_10544 [Ramazzottius varieornatus]|uniref:Uncharacterized protein n=1 Tax=Ramazzottius varieornatus TaxID=947166 RepID=A0A1D1VM40_RAMVA|nr:hypothetical protein RvY_10544 [Ramazzottius varieornatus]
MSQRWQPARRLGTERQQDERTASLSGGSLFRTTTTTSTDANVVQRISRAADVGSGSVGENEYKEKIRADIRNSRL